MAVRSLVDSDKVESIEAANALDETCRNEIRQIAFFDSSHVDVDVCPLCCPSVHESTKVRVRNLFVAARSRSRH